MTSLNEYGMVAFAADAMLVLFGLGIVLALVRLINGPSLPDRVVALDLIATLAVGTVAVHCIVSDEPLYLIVSTVLALITFLGTVAFAYYVAKGGDQ